ncbi:hypothetical protein O6H91_04G037700 [Diphasiastrum complanatum]|uniref:Uncharacterized protein n=1 Tax=Diphasiastrum complanatum TaxID=34168 RepID=A0ACC2DVX2_DIPCM|nr:hypothetical protein O6H91_04G037700 [Diphasiastrum complanatum]
MLHLRLIPGSQLLLLLLDREPAGTSAVHRPCLYLTPITSPQGSVPATGFMLVLLLKKCLHLHVKQL